MHFFRGRVHLNQDDNITAKGWANGMVIELQATYKEYKL